MEALRKPRVVASHKTHGPEIPQDVKQRLADVSKAKELLGFNFYYNMKKDLAKYVEWFKRNPEKVV